MGLRREMIGERLYLVPVIFKHLETLKQQHHLLVGPLFTFASLTLLVQLCLQAKGTADSWQ